jgi:hypothetical protein
MMSQDAITSAQQAVRAELQRLDSALFDGVDRPDGGVDSSYVAPPTEPRYTLDDLLEDSPPPSVYFAASVSDRARAIELVAYSLQFIKSRVDRGHITGTPQQILEQVAMQLARDLDDAYPQDINPAVFLEKVGY